MQNRKIMTIRVFTMFSGYDSQCMALDRLKEKYPEFDYELVGWAEIDKYAIQAHNVVYPQWADRNYGDVSKIDWSKVPDFDLLTYSSPCQDFSQAGKQAGGTEGSGTRSSLLWECRRAILAKKPKYLLMENVAALVSQKFIRLFNAWQLEVERYGYTNFAQVLNAKDYGVPQNRERIFMVSVMNCTQGFYFPTPIPLEKRIKDILEKDVDERYYLKTDAIDGYKPSEKQDDTVVLGWSRDSKGKVVDRHPVKVSNCVTAGKRDNTSNYVVEPSGIEIGISVHPFSRKKEFRGFDTEKAPALRCTDYKCPHCVNNGYRIRKLTERECFRLMGVCEEYIDLIKAAGISRSQQYKMAGNSIVVDVLTAIFEQLLFTNIKQYQQLEIF
jgi:DNA (cytosine-5)-methyltransferase 1